MLFPATEVYLLLEVGLVLFEDNFVVLRIAYTYEHGNHVCRRDLELLLHYVVFLIERN